MKSWPTMSTRPLDLICATLYPVSGTHNGAPRPSTTESTRYSMPAGSLLIARPMPMAKSKRVVRL